MMSSADSALAATPFRSLRLRFALAYLILGSVGAVLLLVRITSQHAIVSSFGFPGFQIPIAIAFGAAGAVILRRRPKNTIGVLLLAEGLFSVTQFLIESAPVILQDSGGDPRLIAWLASVANVVWVPSVLVIGLLLALFPDGRRLPGRWSVVVPALVVGAVVAMAGQLLAPGPLDKYPNLTNPFSVGPILPPGLFEIVPLILFVPLGAAATTLIARWRRSKGDGREQLKWLAFASIPVVIGGSLSFAYPVGSYLMIAAAMAMPVAIAVAVQRYRLYDIDEIVSKTFAYGALTAILAGVYTGALKLFNELFIQVTGTASEGSIILATLVLAAAFTPVRKALEGVIDRRFKQKSSIDPIASESTDGVAAGIDLDQLDVVVRRAVREELAAFGGTYVVNGLRPPSEEPGTSLAQP